MQCRERYLNAARFTGEFEEKKTWSIEEDELLHSLYLKYGPKWVSFLKYFPFK